VNELSMTSTFSDSLWSVIGPVVPLFVLIGAVGIALNILVSRLEKRRKQQEIEARGPLDAKLTKIVELSSELNSLNSEVKAEFDLQLAATKKAQQDAKEAEAIAALNAEERRAAQAMVESAMDLALSKNGKRERAFQIWLAVGSFVAGVVSSVIVTMVLQSLGQAG
jgi:ABC-type transport system involved in cytochrome bd biosynthesis fused ATPase/permease subunit